MKKIFLISAGAIIIFLIFINFSQAIEYPFGNIKGDNVKPSQYIYYLFIWGMGIAGALAVASIAAGGFIYMVGKVDQGKEIIYSALIGLLLLFGTWLILYTINPNLATLKDPTLQSLPSGAGTGTGTGTGAPASGPSSSSDQQVRNDITAAGIGVNKACQNSSNCSVSGGQTCLNGAQPSTVSGIKAIKQNCGCAVTITAGTECGHASGAYSHSNGYKTDLRPDTNLNNYIYGQIGNSSPTQDQNYLGKDGNIYRYETAGGAHWDVCYGCKG